MSAARVRFDIRQASRDLAIVFVAILALNLGFYVLSVRPRVQEYRSLTEESAPRIAELEQRDAARRAREAYRSALGKAEEDLATLRRDVLSTRNQRLIEVQAEVDHLAQMFNVVSEQVTYENEILEDEGLERMWMTIPLQGGYANLRKFIHAVENSDKFLVIERVALAEGDEGGVMLQLNITLATYFDLPESAPDRTSAGRGAGRA